MSFCKRIGEKDISKIFIYIIQIFTFWSLIICSILNLVLNIKPVNINLSFYNKAPKSFTECSRISARIPRKTFVFWENKILVKLRVDL